MARQLEKGIMTHIDRIGTYLTQEIADGIFIMMKKEL